MRARSRRCGMRWWERTATTDNTAVLTNRRPMARAPGENVPPAARMPTNADPQRHTVTRPAMMAAGSATLIDGRAAVINVRLTVLWSALACGNVWRESDIQPTETVPNLVIQLNCLRQARADLLARR